MPGRCAECGCDSSEYSKQDAAGTQRAAETRWRWTVEGIESSILATKGPSGFSVNDHYAAGTGDDIHTGEHHLHAAGRVLHAIGAGAQLATGTVYRLNSSDGGVPKAAVEAADIDYRGIRGDRQATRRHHGRPWQALSLWSLEVIDALAAEGHPIAPGRAGENITVAGIDWASLRPGAVVRVGEVLAQLTAWADPCSNLKPWFIDGDFARVAHDRFPGTSRAYASVLRPGTVRTGDDVIVEPE
jgi:MOSC domain-containing protein YiiM